MRSLTLKDLRGSWLRTRLDCGGLLVTQMEVEEVNPSQNVTTKLPLPTKEQSSKNMMCVTSQDTGAAVVSNHFETFGGTGQH